MSLDKNALAELREAGWTVAVHNDYRLNGVPMTFWLFTHPSGRYVKGEGRTDNEAIAQCFAALPSTSEPGKWDCAAINDWMGRHDVVLSNPAYDELRAMLAARPTSASGRDGE